MADGSGVELGIAGLGPAVRIGSGGFADVYRAQQTNLRREVAVKVLRAAAHDAQAQMRFERECHAVGAVSGHPNIVAVHEGGLTSDGRAYLVMEFFPGGSLLDRLRRTGPMTATEVIEIGIKIGRALAVAHDAGVLHRDVKPANILVSAYGEPALADFGIARVEGGEQTATGMVTASFAHASPEVLEGRAPTARSDIYSLGSTLFELFTGRPPHFRADDESMWALMNRVVSEPVPDPLGVGMPEPLASTVRRATLRSPADRHQAASAFVADLSGEQQGSARTVVTRPPAGSPPPQPPPPNDQRSGRTVAMTGGEGRTEVQPAIPPGVGGAGPMVMGGPPPGAATPEPSTSPPHRRGRGVLVAGLALVVVAVVAVAGTVLVREVTTAPGLPPLAFDFPAGTSGPLDAGASYDLAVRGSDPDIRFRIVLDGRPVGEPEPELSPFVAVAGRHSIAIEVSRGSRSERTDPIQVYAIEDPPRPGYRANLLAVRADPSNWPAALDRFDELVAAGHTELQLLPSDRFASLTPGFWNLFVASFGDDRAAAERYCAGFELDIPEECFVKFFDPDA